jgi:hypothetical protein
MGLYVADPTAERALAEALDTCARSGGLGYWGYDRGSVDFTVGRFGGPGGVIDHAFSSRRIVRRSLRERDSEAVVWKVVVRFQPRIVTLTEDQVAAAVKGTAGWQALTESWQEVDAADSTLRADYPNDASKPVVIDTGLYSRAAAQALADTVLATLKGLKEGYDVVVTAVGQQVIAGQTVTLEFTNQDGVERLGLDGLTRFAVLTTKDVAQKGEVGMELWGGER